MDAETRVCNSDTGLQTPGIGLFQKDSTGIGLLKLFFLTIAGK